MRFQPPRPKSDDERILPLINVVFLLLIFFMLTGKLASVDPIEVTPPRSASEGTIDARELVIVIGANGDLAFDGERIDQASLEESVAKRLIGDAGLQVWLKADSGTDSVQVITIMETLREAGVERLKLLTIPAVIDRAG